jgi:anti-anti-sigma factor
MDDWRELLRTEKFFCELVEGDGPAVLILVGKLTEKTAPQMEACVESLDEDCEVNLLIDLEYLMQCDQTGISALIETCGMVRARGGSASVICPSRKIRLAFKLAGVYRYLTDGETNRF